MQPVEKIREVTQDILSLDEIRLCKEVGRLVKEIPDEKIRFPQINKLWETHIGKHPGERNWYGQGKTQVILLHIAWMKTLQARKCTAEELFDKMQDYIKQTEDSPLIFFHQTELWIYKRYIYKVDIQYSYEQAQWLIREAFDRERTYWERLEQKYDRGQEISQNDRPRVPENVRIEVWRRDGGKCARCGSRENLEYDHIIPLSRGGSNTTRNIELLCEKCNRQKGANIQ